jgi:hypothetical protein
MTFTCPKQTSITDSELQQTFPGLLPATPNGDSDRDSAGLLVPNAIQAIIASLKGSGVIPSIKDTKSQGGSKQAALLSTIKSEYCFYDSRYKYALEKIFSEVQHGYLTNTPATSANTSSNTKKYIALAQALNRRLNDLIQLVNAITEDMMSTSTSMDTEMTNMSQSMQEQKKKLDQQNKTISSNEAAMKIRKEMVKYSEEKARHTDNLLKLYSFLNVVALGLLVYIYKAAN